ncbi:MAG: hypothetical protein J6N78_02790 [Clostridia bacterium]|nr:hypothetical protein [Clostridia bacterium]
MGVMDGLQNYIVDHNKDLNTKMEIVRRLQKLLEKRKGEKIFFDKSVIFKTEIARMFIDYMHLDVDRDLVLTACLLCNCKKVDNPQKIGKLTTFVKEGADYLPTLGFEPRFCRICKGVNRYSEQEEKNKGEEFRSREPESDILELVDHFGGMMLDRPERAGFSPEEALIQMERDNLKGKNNRYLSKFHEFVSIIQQIDIKEGNNSLVSNKILPRFKKIVDNNSIDKLTMTGVIGDFNKAADAKVKQKFFRQEALFGGIEETTNNNFSSRPMFTQEAILAARRASGFNYNNNTQNNRFNQNKDDDFER